MALFKTTAEKAKKTTKVKTSGVKTAQNIVDAGAVILRPRITEKAAIKTGDNVYTFEVSVRATKKEIEKAIAAIYKVVPVKVNIVSIAPRKIVQRSRKGSPGTRSGMKKAYVFLKDGDKIEFA